MTKDRNIKVYVTEIAKKALGGLIGTYQRLASGGSVGFRNMLSGGFMSGFGGGDRRAILGEDGEYMLNKFSVREAGLAAAAYFNNRDWPALVRELVDRFGISAAPVIRRATGGAINSISLLPKTPSPAAATSGDIIRHEHLLRSPGGKEATVWTDDSNAEKFFDFLEEEYARQS